MSGAVHYRVRHQTRYEYASDVVHSHQLLHLIPRPSAYQECLEHDIHVVPSSYRRRNELDAFGNLVSRVEFDHPHRELIVATDMEIRVHPRPLMPASESAPWEHAAAELTYRGSEPARETLEASRFRHESPHVRIKGLFDDYSTDCFPRNRPILACAEELMSKLHRELRYAPGETTIATPLVEVLKKRRGVCQDFAHLMIACLRSRGLAARYVSGYIRQTSAPEARQTDDSQPDVSLRGGSQIDTPQADDSQPGGPEPHDGAPLTGSGASHAWVAVYAPPFGWIELDPTNNMFVGTDHITVAWGRDFADVSPLRGVILGGGNHRVSVEVKVEESTENGLSA